MYGFVPAAPLPLSRPAHCFRSTCAGRIVRGRHEGRDGPKMVAQLSRRALGHAALATAAAALLPGRGLAQLLAPPVSAPVARREQAARLRELVAAAVAKDPSIAATLLRLAFHDSFTTDLVTGKGGANGSIRLETGRSENFGLQRAVDVLEPMQAETGLGWGDTVAVAGAAAVEATGGPRIEIRLGRDSATEEDPRGALPSPSETAEELRKRFAPRGFTDLDIVALSGAHTLGRDSGGGPFVAQPNRFSNDYFKNLMWFQRRRERGLSEKSGPPDRPNFQLPSDLGLLDDPETLKFVRQFANDKSAFFNAFATSYNKMVAVGTPFAASP